jgi:hypothetical protein
LSLLSQASQCLWARWWNGLLIDTWCHWVCVFLNLFLIVSGRRPRHASVASSLHGFDNAPGRRSHTHPSQSSINSNVMHALLFRGQNYYIFANIFFWHCLSV